MQPDEAPEDVIVRRIHETFDALPKKFKPRDKEWTTLSALATIDSKSA